MKGSSISKSLLLMSLGRARRHSLRGLYLCVILLLTTAHGSSSQNSSRRAFFITRYETGGSGLEGMMEYSAPILEYFKHFPSSTLVVRLCSKKPLPVAISTAAIDPLILTRYLSRYSLPDERIIVSRSETCLGKLTTNTATELWVVIPNKQYPEAKESIKVCQVEARELKSRSDEKRGIRIGTHDHNLAVKKLVSELKADPESTGIVLGYYLRNPDKKIKRKLLHAQRILQKSGLPQSRYYAQLMHWTGFPEVEDQLGYLRIGTIKINDECRSLGEGDGIVWID